MKIGFRGLCRGFAALLTFTLLCGACAKRESEPQWVKLDYSIEFAPPAALGRELSALSDGDRETLYEGQPRAQDMPKSGNVLIFDLGQPIDSIARLVYTPRQDGGTAGRIEKYRIYVSKSDISYENLELSDDQLELDVLFNLAGEGQFDWESDKTQTATFRPLRGRFVALHALFNGGGGQAISAAEIAVYQGFRADESYGSHQEALSEALKVAEEKKLPGAQKTADAYSALLGNDTEAFNRFTSEEQARLLNEMTALKAQYQALPLREAPQNGTLWLADDGAPVQAHGGNILYNESEKKYYWYGVDASGGNLDGGAYILGRGVRCYSSADLINWTDLGLVLPLEDAQKNPHFNQNTQLSHPQVLYNEANGQYVLWWQQSELRQGKLQNDFAGVALSDSPAGPFRWQSSGQLLLHSADGGAAQYGVSDLSLFQESGGKAYLLFTAVSKEAFLVPLNKDYTGLATDARSKTTGWTPLPPESFRTQGAPLLLRGEKTYYLLTRPASAKAYAPMAVYASASLASDAWEAVDLVLIDDVWGNGFCSQPSALLPQRDESGEVIPGSYLLLADRSNPYDQEHAGYLRLPLKINEKKQRVTAEWTDSAAVRRDIHALSAPVVLLILATSLLFAAGAGLGGFYLLRRHGVFTKKKTEIPEQPAEGTAEDEHED
ncbi:MAG: family 43 glycosylhydrolase [Oscillospiraceae bacterium]|nr:family 43 glycosylhydrolase [Oscillospiraceae bacterium]